MNPNETPGKIPVEQALDRYGPEDAQLIGLPSPGSLNLLKVFIKTIQGSPLFPKSLMNGPNPEATLLSVILTGREMRLSPMQSLRAYWLSPDGRLGMYGAAMLGVMRAAGFKFEWIKDDDDGCEMKGTRPDGETYTARFSHEDALTAGVWQRDKSLHPKYPRRMCKWRCVSDMWNTLASDLGGSFSPVYTAEELREEFPEVRERGDASDGVFQEEARRQTAENPFPVGRKTTEPAANAPAQPQESPRADNPAPATAKASGPPDVRPPVPKEDQPPLFTEKQTVPVDKLSDPEPRPETQDNAGAPIRSASPVVSTTTAKASAPKVTPIDGKKTVKQIMTELTDFLPTVSPEKLVSKTFPEFVRGFTNADLKKVKREQVDPALSFLPHILRDYKSQFLQDPHGMGVMCGAGWNKFLRWFDDSWPADCKQMAIAIGVQRYSDTGGFDLTEFLVDPADVKSMNPSELRTFMQVLSITREAMLLRDAASKYGCTMLMIVDSWDLDLAQATEDQVVACLRGALANGIDGIAEPAGSSPDPATDEEDELGLFED